MGKRNLETSKEEGKSLFKYKSHSVDEIMAAGGPIAFSDKLGKNSRNILAELKKLPKDAFLTDKEFEEAMKTLNQSK